MAATPDADRPPNSSTTRFSCTSRRIPTPRLTSGSVQSRMRVAD